MLGALDAGAATGVRYIHTTRTPGTEAFGPYIRALAAKGMLCADLFYSRATPEAAQDATGVTTHAGRMTPAWLAQEIDRAVTYYICGPDGFMRDTIATLKAGGVPESQIRFEFFGSAADAALVG